MPRILTPNSSFQRRNSTTYRVNVTYRPTNTATASQLRQRRYSDAGTTSRVTQGKSSAASFHSWQYHNNNTPPSSSGPHPATTSSPPLPLNSAATSPSSRFRVVTNNNRRKSLPDAPSTSYSPFIPKVEEDVWGQFVDVTEEEEKIIRHSRILSRA